MKMKKYRPRQRAVELFEQDIADAELEGRETVTVPVFAAKVILACAKDGQHRGQGRGHPPDSETNRIAKEAVVWTAQTRWAELGWKRGTKVRAAQETLAEVREEKRRTTLGKRVNLSIGYLVELMGPKPKPKA